MDRLRFRILLGTAAYSLNFDYHVAHVWCAAFLIRLYCSGNLNFSSCYNQLLHFHVSKLVELGSRAAHFT